MKPIRVTESSSPHCSTQNPNEFLLDEVWDTRIDFDRHFESSKSHNDRERVKPLLLKPLLIKTYVNILE